MNFFSIDPVFLLVPIFCLLPIVIIIAMIARSAHHRHFIQDAERVEKGMSLETVKYILGEPTSFEEIDDIIIAVWEKRQWVGMLRGGTVSREIKVTFKNGVVLSTSIRNFDKSTF